MARRIMLMMASGGNEHFTMKPIKQLVEVYMAPDEFMGIMRVNALKEIIELLEQNPLFNTSDMQLELLRSLKLRLVNTDLKEFPEDPLEYSVIVRALEETVGKS